MKKRGQSQIITTVLIILLVLAAVILVWNVVKNVVTEGSKQIDIDILTVDTTIKSGTVYINQTSKELQLDMTRDSDDADINRFKVILICKDGSTENYMINTSQIIKPLETKTYYIKDFNCNVTEIEIYPVSTDGQFGLKESYTLPDSQVDTAPTGGFDTSTTLNEWVEETGGSCMQQTYYLDYDEDTYGHLTNSTLSCNPIGFYTTLNNTDCNDNDTTINPGATDGCYTDRDCSGSIDPCISFTKLIGWWDMENTAGSSLIAREGIFNGIIGNAIQVIGQAGFGQAIHFDGDNDYITIPGTANITDNLTEVSISAWVKLDSLTGSNMNIFASITNPPSGGINLYVTASGNASMSAKLIPSGRVFCQGQNLNLNQWYNIIGIVNGTDILIYVDGVLGDNCLFTTPIKPGSPDLTIGSISSLNGWFMNGTIDDIIFFNRTLTDAEIAILSTP